MNNLVNQVKAILGLKFDVCSFEAKNRVFKLNHQYMNMFEFVRCSKNDGEIVQCSIKWCAFDPSLVLIEVRLHFYLCNVEKILQSITELSNLILHVSLSCKRKLAKTSASFCVAFL